MFSKGVYLGSTLVLALGFYFGRLSSLLYPSALSLRVLEKLSAFSHFQGLKNCPGRAGEQRGVLAR